MPRRLRCALGGFVYHALNRGVARCTIFAKSGDYAAFEKVLRQAAAQVPLRLLAWCCMPNHGHLVVWPRHDGELSAYLHWVPMTHTQRWHAHYHTAGTGPVYQGRFKAFAVQEDEHLLAVCRYVERNPLRAGLVARAEHWRWSSLWHRVKNPSSALLHAGPVAMPEGWLEHVNRPETAAELEALRRSVARGLPFGGDGWRQRTAEQMGLSPEPRPRGRPRKGMAQP